MHRNGLVSKYYQTKPDKEVLIPSGLHLREGMIVLVEDYTKRANLDSIGYKDAAGLEHAMRWNRWMKISHLSHRDNYTWFVATYEHGPQRKIQTHYETAWIAKRDSFEGDDIPTATNMLYTPANRSITFDEYMYESGQTKPVARYPSWDQQYEYTNMPAEQIRTIREGMNPLLQNASEYTVDPDPTRPIQVPEELWVHSCEPLTPEQVAQWEDQTPKEYRKNSDSLEDDPRV